MSISRFVSTIKNFGRLQEILGVLVKHGFGRFVDKIHLKKYLFPSKRVLGIKGKKVREYTVAERTVMALEELGPTFIKFGQILSTRADLIPTEFVKELRKLQDDVPPFSAEIAKKLIEEQLKAPLPQVFSNFTPEPFASGSIAQAHYAQLKNGVEVVVKIRRPGIEKIIGIDLSLLRFIAEALEKHIPESHVFKPLMLVNEFSQIIHRELDFVTEGSNTSLFYEQYKDNDKLKTPKVFWEYTTSSVLVLERLKGLSIYDTQGMKDSNIDVAQLSDNLARSFIEQFLLVGLFHGDPHPGNIFIQPDGKIGLIDFGMIGHISEELKAHLSTIFIALFEQEYEIVVDVLTDMGIIDQSIDMGEIISEMSRLFDKYYGIPIRKINFQLAFFEFMDIIRKHGLILPRDFLLLEKSFAMITGLIIEMNPDYNYTEMLESFVKPLLMEKFSRRHLRRRLVNSMWYMHYFFTEGPRNLKNIVSKLLTGNLELVYRHKGLEHLVKEMDRSSNRIAFALVLAAIVIGSSLVILAKAGPLVLGNVSILGVIGFIIAGILGVYLLISILRSGKL